MDDPRAYAVKSESGGNGPVALWMHREHRARDNHALLFAQSLAERRKVPLVVLYGLAPAFLEAATRQFDFLLRGLRETSAILESKGIPFLMRLGSPEEVVPEMVRELKVSALVMDFDVLRLKRGWMKTVADSVHGEVWEVDSRNTVPCRVASDKREYAARTIRPKIHKRLSEFLVEPPELPEHPFSLKKRPETASFEEAFQYVRQAPALPETNFVPGEEAAAERLEAFIGGELDSYGKGRNVPTNPGVSRLSPYLHFGQISALRVLWEVTARGRDRDSVAAYVEQLVVRRELSDNFCFHDPDYDNPGCFADWAVGTLEDHLADDRPYVYSLEQLEKAATHDDLWNAAQLEMVRTGHMHNYMRMYWAKKILEWTPHYAEAMERAIYLNDRYQLDGRDSNGYTGVAWSIGGVHDRGWTERPIFGKIRYMSYNGAKSKFRIREYIDAQTRPALL
ncbi:deoxyribodipyrimidine photo-lyase [Desulfovibrio oxyclinae]|uniref:deoxyribodipyrimidine photo-lyase n=1 Tax=Desulfovibrio oxyclinae TaxID=63560 RepID=UPI0004755023|nr:deoxyribodipyrimidine photo-lyase [Desulfovibrio oxyclinae]